MQVSAEIRWFWSEEPVTVVRWFHDATLHKIKPGQEREREDCYLRDSRQDELGLKVRGAKPGIECKGLVARPAPGIETGPFAGGLEIWCKWTSEALNLPLEHMVCVTKQRAIRKFDTTAGAIEVKPDDRPATGCNVELTEVALPDGSRWWSLGFEAFGSLETVTTSLIRTAEELSTRSVPDLTGAVQASYPAWLKAHVPVAD